MKKNTTINTTANETATNKKRRFGKKPTILVINHTDPKAGREKAIAAVAGASAGAAGATATAAIFVALGARKYSKLVFNEFKAEYVEEGFNMAGLNKKELKSAVSGWIMRNYGNCIPFGAMGTVVNMVTSKVAKWLKDGESSSDDEELEKMIDEINSDDEDDGDEPAPEVNLSVPRPVERVEVAPMQTFTVDQIRSMIGDVLKDMGGQTAPQQTVAQPASQPTVTVINATQQAPVQPEAPKEQGSSNSRYPAKKAAKKKK